jgi:hypothetical protein
MKTYKPAMAILLAIAVMGLSGCNGRDRGLDRDHADERRDHYRDDHPCDRNRDPHCDDRH